MRITAPDIFSECQNYIEELYGAGAGFRPGQYEAIEATMTHHRTLVVQKTGWGKSLVYFICTRLLRARGRGVTLVVSPLLVLMENQMESARKSGLRCDVLNSQTRDRRENILEKMKAGALDLVLVTPETLFSKEVQGSIRDIPIGLFVIDEAHCISDWGHDFRLEYFKLKQVISQIPSNVPVLGTTATANDRVVADLQAQFGEDVYVSRGPLTRESLAIQVLHLPQKEDRYAWILENINRLPGSGIIYCLTQRDCDYLADFLNNHGIPACSYYSRDGKEELKNVIAEKKFSRNQIKAIVATIKLGMGYDKGDISFVIHLQTPSSIVSYYQQIGRAGRAIRRAYTFLMTGKEDEDINNSFIKNAFPTEENTLAVLGVIRRLESASVSELEAQLNIRRSKIKQVLMFLSKDGFIYKDGSRYYRSPKPFVYDREHYDAIRAIRVKEMAQMKALTETTGCYSKFVVNALDDFTAEDCGVCANCLHHSILPERPSLEYRESASEYLNGLILPILPRKQWKVTSVTRQVAIRFRNMEGICLSKYGAPGAGEWVQQDKYSPEKRFRDELVERAARILGEVVRKNQLTHITCVPSLRSDLVKDFTLRLARRLRLPFVEILGKREAIQQKNMENSSHQCENAYCSFYVEKEAKVPARLILVDDMVDSRWTLTACGNFLGEAGAEAVFPFALADSSNREEKNNNE